MANIYRMTIFILALICSSNFSIAAVSKQMTLVGEVISFDQTHVKVRSGKQEYVFSKKELDHPSYVVGSRIEIPFDKDKMKPLKVKKNKSRKN